MRALALLTAFAVVWPHPGAGQGLREVPQRFAYVQPVGLLLGVGAVGFEFRVSRTASVEVGGVGVYSVEDGIRMYGGGPGIGVRKYFGQAEAAGLVLGARVDGVWLEADNSGAERGFLAGPLQARRDHVYLGLGGLLGYRWVFPSGFFAEPSISYEYFAGPRPLVPGSRAVQDDLGLAVGLAFGLAW